MTTTQAISQGVDIPTGTWTLDPAHTRAWFVARHLVVTKVRGEFTGLEGTIEVAEDPTQSTVAVTFDTGSLTTGSADRDGHLRSPDFFDVEQYPKITFNSTKVARAGDGWVLEGDLSVKDVTQQVKLPFTLEGVAVSPFGKTVAAFSGQVEVDREKWGLTWNMPLEKGGFLVSKKVTLEIEAEAIKN